MKKIITLLFVTLFLICGCQTPKKEVDVWYVEPVEGYDDIDAQFVLRSGQGYGFDMAGSWPAALFGSYIFSFNRHDYYNSDLSDNFYGSFEKGGLQVIKDDKYGILRPNGAMAYETVLDRSECYNKYCYFLDKGNTYPDVCSIERDYTVGCRETFVIGAGTDACSNVFFTKDGKLIYPSTESLSYGEINDTPSYSEKYEIFEMDVYQNLRTSESIEGNDFILINTYASFVDCRHYMPNINALKETIEGYIAVGKDGYRVLPISNNYVVMDFSSNIAMFGKANYGPEIKNGNYYLRSQQFYAYDLYKDNYSYCDITYVDVEGNIIANGFDDGFGFYEGFAPVKKDGKWGFINTDGELVVDYIFDKATPIADGKTWVIYKGRTGRLNIKEMLDNRVQFNEITLCTWE